MSYTSSTNNNKIYKFSTTTSKTKTIHSISSNFSERCEFLRSVVSLFDDQNSSTSESVFELPSLIDTETFGIFIKFLELWPDPPVKSLTQLKCNPLSARINFTKSEKSFINKFLKKNEKNRLLNLCLIADFFICERLINLCHRILAHRIASSDGTNDES